MRRLATTLLLAIALGISACGGDDDDGGDKQDPRDYASDFCGAAQEWVDAIRSGARDLGGLDRDATPREGREALGSFFDQTVKDTDEFAAELDAAGEPDVSGGADAAKELKDAVAQAKDILEDARAQTEDLPVSDERAFATEARKVGRSTRDSLSRVGDAIDEPRSGELREAIRDTPGCQRLRQN
jgi:hypothetical protein